MTHPPGHPTGPTGPGRDADIEQHHTGIGEPNEHSVPTHYETDTWTGADGFGAECACGVTFDGFDTYREAYAQLKAHIASGNTPTPVSNPLPRVGEWVRDLERTLAQALNIADREVDPASLPGGNVFEICQAIVGLHIEAALRDLAKVTERPLPAVGSTPQFPARQDPASGSVATPGAPVKSGPSPNAAPVASGRGVGPGFLGPIAQSVTEALSRRSQ